MAELWIGSTVGSGRGMALPEMRMEEAQRRWWRWAAARGGQRHVGSEWKMEELVWVGAVAGDGEEKEGRLAAGDGEGRWHGVAGGDGAARTTGRGRRCWPAAAVGGDGEGIDTGRAGSAPRSATLRTVEGCWCSGTGSRGMAGSRRRGRRWEEGGARRSHGLRAARLGVSPEMREERGGPFNGGWFGKEQWLPEVEEKGWPAGFLLEMWAVAVKG